MPPDYTSSTNRIFLDARYLEPPEPLIESLNVLQNLEGGQYLHLLHTRPPLLLYPELKPLGLISKTYNDKNNFFHILVWQEADNAAGTAANQHLTEIMEKTP